MAALRSRRRHYIFALRFLFLSSFFFPRLISAIADWMSAILPHDVALVQIYDAGLKCVAHSSLKIQDAKSCQKIAIWAPSHSFVWLYLHNWGTYRQSEKNLLNGNISPTCLHNMVNFGPLTAEICLPVWDTPANFNKFRVLPSFLQQCCSPEASPVLVHYIYIFRGLLPLTEFCLVQNSLYVQVLRSPILATLLHGTPVVGISQTLGAWYKQWNYGTFAEGATYIRLGGHHIDHRPTF